MKNIALKLTLSVFTVFGLLFGPVFAADPVNITYGYHPYWTGGWNGVIIKDQELWKKYLPEGSTVNFEAHLTGPPMVNALLADKMQIGTMGDMPSLVATTKRKLADVRLVSAPMFSNGQNCNKVRTATKFWFAPTRRILPHSKKQWTGSTAGILLSTAARAPTVSCFQ